MRPYNVQDIQTIFLENNDSLRVSRQAHYSRCLWLGKRIPIGQYKHISKNNTPLPLDSLPILLKANKFSSIFNESFKFKMQTNPAYLHFRITSNQIFSPTNPTSENELLLEAIHPFIEKMHIYKFVADSLVQTQVVGNDTTNYAASRIKKHQNFLVPLKILPGETADFFVKVGTEFGSTFHLNFNLLLWANEAIRGEQSEIETSIYTSYIVLITVCLMLLFFVIRYAHSNFQWQYFFFAVVGLFFIICDNGIAYRYLWFNYPVIHFLSPFLIGNLYAILGVLFMRQLFLLKHEYPRINLGLEIQILFVAIISIAIVICTIIAQPNFEATSYLRIIFLVNYAIYLLITTTIVFAVFYYIIRKKQYFFVMFALSFLLHGAGLVIRCLEDLGFVDKNFPFNNIPSSNIFIPYTINTNALFMVGLILEIFFVFILVLRQMVQQFKDLVGIAKDLATEREHNLNALMVGIETERKRIAQELHDGIGVMLSTLKMNISTLKDHAKTNDALQDDITKITKDLDNAHKEIRYLSHNLMPKTLETIGLKAAIEEYVHRLKTATKLDIHYYSNIDLDIVHDQAKIHIYRIVQELINNIIKHSGANELHLQFMKLKDTLLISIEDNGCGFDINKVRYKGMGFSNLEYRVEAMKGILEIESTPNIGSSFSIELPLASISQHSTIKNQL